MVRPIMRDIFFLRQKAQPATKEDKQIVQDLLDTLKANEAGCVGMAANMIGVNKRIIAVNMGFINVAMLNPVIVKKPGHTRQRRDVFLLTVCERLPDMKT